MPRVRVVLLALPLATVLGSTLAVGCGHDAEPPRTPMQPSPPGTAKAEGPGRPQSSAVPASRGPTTQVALEPQKEKPAVPAAFGIAEPRQGALVPGIDAARQHVTLRGVSGEVLVALDDHTPRRVTTGSVRLGALLLEDEELAPGFHRLVVVRETEAAFEVAASTFFVGDEAPPSVPPPSGVVLLEPHGTYNGDKAADAIRVVAFGLDATSPLAVRVSGPTVSSERNIKSGALRVQGLPSGDFRIDAIELSGADPATAVPRSGRWSTMGRVITVNRDAPEPPSAAQPSKGSAG